MAHKIVSKIVKIWIMMFCLSGGVFSKTSDADNSGSGSGNSDGECSEFMQINYTSSYFRGIQFLYFHEKRVTHRSAQRSCSCINATLASIKDNATQNHIVNNMPIDDDCNRTFYYIGLFLKPDGIWYWPDDVPLGNFSKWRQSKSKKNICEYEPNGFKGCSSQPGLANATQIGSCTNHSTSEVGDWFDKNQEKSKWYYICEKPVSPTSFIPQTQEISATTQQSTVSPTPSKTATEKTIEEETTTSFNSSTISPPEALPSLGSAKRQQCWNEIIIDIEKSLMRICSYEVIFGKHFSIEEWETKLSYYLGEALLRYDLQKSIKISNFSGIDIGLYKVNYLEDLDEIFDENSDSFSVTFQKNLNSKFLVDYKSFLKIPRPFVLVTALIENKLWEQSNLSSASPLNPLKNVALSGKAKLNQYFEFIPKDESLLSFSAFVKTSKKIIKKVSIPVNPQIELPLDPKEKNILSAVDRNSNHRIALNGIEYQCAFVDHSEPTTRWSSHGCRFVAVENGTVSCSCNHTTTFGVFLAVRAFSVPIVVTLLVVSLEIITVLALTVTIILLLWLKRSMNNDRTIVQINLAVSLLLLHMFFLLSDYARNKVNPEFCEACAVITQFFTLTTSFWMLNEGIVLYFKTYKNALSFNLKKVFPVLAAVAWGFPLVYVSLCAGIGIRIGKYLDEKSSDILYKELSSNLTKLHDDSSVRTTTKYNTCYVGFRNNMIYSVIVPLAIILVITSFIITKTSVKINAMTAELSKMKPTGRFVRNSEKDAVKLVRPKRLSSMGSPRKKIIIQASAILRAVVLLLPVLGITWFLAFLVNIPKAEVAFVIVHGVINGLQGVFIFYIYCYKNSHFRRVFNRKWKEFSTNFMGTDYNSNKFSRQASHLHSNHYGAYSHKQIPS